MAETKIKVNDNGPYVVTGTNEIIDAEGNVFETKKRCLSVAAGNPTTSRFATAPIKRLDLKAHRGPNNEVPAGWRGLHYVWATSIKLNGT